MYKNSWDSRDAIRVIVRERMDVTNGINELVF